jgi:hypothetical protein
MSIVAELQCICATFSTQGLLQSNKKFDQSADFGLSVALHTPHLTINQQSLLCRKSVLELCNNM